ncbi:hypothetical protein BX600DRAFT_499674 [Xylariales sp. PMI_506]|nr:hypothetical protein BX600DRAFT_499674 [Xylariales sp. PMI_506]
MCGSCTSGPELRGFRCASRFPAGNKLTTVSPAIGYSQEGLIHPCSAMTSLTSAYGSTSFTNPALTTTFTAPASCSSAPWTYADIFSVESGSTVHFDNVTTLEQLWNHGIFLPTQGITRSLDQFDCFPSGYGGLATFSPGICPYGSTTVTAIQTSGSSIAICCPSIEWRSSSGTVLTAQGQASVGPGVLSAQAIYLVLPTESSSITQPASLISATASSVQSQLSMTADSLSMKIDGLSNGAVIGIACGAGVLSIGLLALGFFLLRGRSGHFSSSALLSTTSAFYLALATAAMFGIASCMLAARPAWQEELIRRWDSPNPVLRLVQALSFILRLCATAVAWFLVVDLGWLLMCRGMTPGQIARLLDLAVSGGSYTTLWDALWSHLRPASALNTSILLLAAFVAIASDLVGNGLIAGTGVGFIAGGSSIVEMVPFVQAGFVNRGNTTTFGGEDQSQALFSSANYYPHIVQSNDTLAFLPVQAGDAIPSAYSGVGFFGSLKVDCKPAKISGSVFVSTYSAASEGSTDLNHFGMEGAFETPFDNMGSMENVTYTKSGLMLTQQDFSSSPPIIGAWSIPQPNSPQDLQYLAVLTVMNLNESFVTASPKNQSQGALNINDYSSPNYGKAGGYYTSNICRVELPSSFGMMAVMDIENNALPAPSCSLDVGLCPNVTIYAASPSARFTNWTDTQLLSYLNASYVDSDTTSHAMAPFADGVIFCQSCNATGLAARVLSSYVASSATAESDSSEPLAANLQTAILHAVAFTYRNELPTLNGKGIAHYALFKAATLITAPAWIYASVAYVWVLGIVAFLLHWYTLRLVAVNRSGSSLAVASLIMSDDTSPLARLVRSTESSWLNTEQVRSRIDKMKQNRMRLGIVSDGSSRFGVGDASMTPKTLRRPGNQDARSSTGRMQGYRELNELEHDRASPSAFSTAYLRCRRLRRKCDTMMPRCRPCEKTGHECTFIDPSLNQVVSRSHVHSLLEQLEHLRAIEGVVASSSDNSNPIQSTATSRDESSFDIMAASSSSSPADQAQYWGSSSVFALAAEVVQHAVISKVITPQDADLGPGTLRPEDSGEDTADSNTFERQMMCAAPADVQHLVSQYLASFNALYRFVDEAQAPSDVRVYLTAKSRYDLDACDLRGAEAHGFFRVSLMCAVACAHEAAGRAAARRPARAAESLAYYGEALGCLEEVTSEASPQSLQAVLLLIVYYLYYPRKGDIWKLLDYACRLTVELGYHQAGDTEGGEEEEAETAAANRQDVNAEDTLRRSTFWGVYALERIIGQLFGRGSDIPEKIITVGYPTHDLSSGDTPISHYYRLVYLRSEIYHALCLPATLSAHALSLPWLREKYEALQAWRASEPSTEGAESFSASGIVGLSCSLAYSQSMCFLFQPLLLYALRHTQERPEGGGETSKDVDSSPIIVVADSYWAASDLMRTYDQIASLPKSSPLGAYPLTFISAHIIWMAASTLIAHALLALTGRVRILRRLCEWEVDGEGQVGPEELIDYDALVDMFATCSRLVHWCVERWPEMSDLSRVYGTLMQRLTKELILKSSAR